MLRKFTAGSLTGIVITSMSLVLLVIGTSTFLALSNILSSLKQEGNPDILERKITFVQYYIVIELLSILVLTICISLIIKKIFQDLQMGFKNKQEALTARETELKCQNELISNLAELYKNSLEYDRMKTEFFYNVSHELKTPLSVILGAVQLINQKSVTAGMEQKSMEKNLKVIKQNSYRLVRLLNNILDIARIDSGSIKANMVECNIVSLIEEITMSVAPYAEQKGLSLEFDTEEEEILTSVDIDKIDRIILNLLSNAIKFSSPGGKVAVNTARKRNMVLISVKDTGPGIPKDMQDVIFERFKQVNSELTRAFEGSGIGLSIVKSFVDLHNGIIQVASEENKGSEFIIELPVRSSQGDPEAAQNFKNGQNRIVEAIKVEFSDIYSTAS